MKTVFNKDKNQDATKQPMFFGDDLSVQRYDTFKYPLFDKLTQQQLGYFWRPEEVSLQKDRNDYSQLSEGQKFIFTSNLKYQTMLDSVQGRGPCLAFLPFVSIKSQVTIQPSNSGKEQKGKNAKQGPLPCTLSNIV